MPLDWHPCQLCYPLEIRVVIIIIVVVVVLVPSSVNRKGKCVCG